ncbi:Retrovirus-related Pol polyprotein from transposon TNT 1-94 [Porphyridium purpureum]|uniref:Retrovirus-related Pol polyprotein from transposon TNT 1-94 n=1 Tax=Porphyridium purpureum TaxID=35688 RepID=A0A5J4YJ47_PORPP|nr:Retrovirus-related Pol polyprotein from transposon TNT 1-94 [Porphyridium purpureum]|eukprot:POR9000..scf225_25
MSPDAMAFTFDASKLSALANGVEKFNGENYDIWARRTKLALRVVKLWPVVAGMVVRPSSSSRATTGMTAEEWDDADLAGQFFLSGVLENRYDRLVRDKSSADGWSAVATYAHDQLSAQKFAFRMALERIVQNKNEAMAEYLDRGIGLWDKLVSIGEQVPEDHVVRYLVIGLRKEFQGSKDYLLHSAPTVSAARLQLLQLEAGKALERTLADEPPPIAMAVSQRPQQQQRDRSAGVVKTALVKENLKCGYCHKVGHETKRCFKRKNDLRDKAAGASGAADPEAVKRGIGKPNARVNVVQVKTKVTKPPAPAAKAAIEPGWMSWEAYANSVAGRGVVPKGPSLDIRMISPPATPAPINKATTSIYAICVSVVPHKHKSHKWMFDSGSDRHITWDRSILMNERPSDESLVTVANGEHVEVSLMGDVMLKTIIQDKFNDLRLENVLLIESTPINLLSTKVAARKGCVFKHDDSSSVLHFGSDGPVLAVGDGDLMIKLSAARINAITASNKFELFHRRLGHPGLAGLKNTQNCVQGIPADLKVPDEYHCVICQKAKGTRTPFKKRKLNSISAVPGEVLHTDVCGPLTPSSFDDHRYFLVVVDECSSLSVVHLLERKSEAGEMLLRTLKYLETTLGAKAKRVRSDKGGEFASLYVQRHLQDSGITWENTSAYTPELNGMAERMNRTLLEKVRSLLFDSNLPLENWSNALLTANYLRNRISNNRGKTPIEIAFRQRPDLSNLRIYGSRAFVHIPKQLRGKLETRSAIGCLVGYGNVHSVYRILLSDGTVVESRNVTFDESVVGIDVHEHEIHDSEYFSNFDKIVEELFPKDFSKSFDEKSQIASKNFETDSTRQMDDRSQEYSISNEIGETFLEKVQNNSKDLGFQKAPNGNFGNTEDDESQDSGYVANQFVGIISTVSEPRSVEEALKGDFSEQWLEALNRELESLTGNCTWELVDRPQDRIPVRCKWVFKIKYNVNGQIDRFKCRLVAKGFTQKPGLDYDEVFSPVVRHNTIRTVLAVAAARKLKIRLFDVVTAFLNGELHEEIFMEQPPGFVHEGGKVLKLRKAIYGLKQASRAWNQVLVQALKEINFSESTADPCLFSKGPNGPYIMIYVDDLVFIGEDEVTSNEVLLHLQGKFEVRDLGQVVKQKFAGYTLDYDQRNGIIRLNQSLYVQTILERFGMESANPRKLPMEKDTKWYTATAEPCKMPYMELVGALMYLCTCTRPDISFAVGVLARSMANANESHWNAAKGVLRYLKGTINYGLQFSSNGNSDLIGYVDSDYASDLRTRRSTTGYAFTINGSVVSWKSRLQPTVALSTTEAEYMALSDACKEAQWFQYLMEFLGFKSKSIPMFCDNDAALKLSENPIVHERSKHIDVRKHYARECQQRGIVKAIYIRTSDQAADFLTKVVPREMFLKCKTLLGVACLENSR